MKFRVVAIQSNVTMVDPNQSEAEIKKVVRANLDRALELIDWAARESGPGPKLIVLPESFLHSFPRGTCPTMKKLMPMALSIPGEETKKLGEKAKEYQAYICGATYEYMEDWPGRIWNAGFIIDPSGNVALKRHKTASESGSGPVFVFNEYVERYGINAIYPVLDTPLGRLGVLICNGKRPVSRAERGRNHLLSDQHNQLRPRVLSFGLPDAGPRQQLLSGFRQSRSHIQQRESPSLGRGIDYLRL